MRFCQIIFQKITVCVRLERFFIFFVLCVCERSFQLFEVVLTAARRHGGRVVYVEFFSEILLILSKKEAKLFLGVAIIPQSLELISGGYPRF
jgi:hypothetical protein